jgi:hypothetical protein
MDDQEGIHNMYPPTRQARAGKIQIDCCITMDDQEGIQNICILQHDGQGQVRYKLTVI